MVHDAHAKNYTWMHLKCNIAYITALLLPTYQLMKCFYTLYLTQELTIRSTFQLLQVKITTMYVIMFTKLQTMKNGTHL